jgi:hypothetical protein
VKERWTRRWFRKRALLYHLLVVIIAPGCLWAGWWQVHRAMQGNTLSYFYSFEWPIFAILSVVGWWQLIHEDPADVDARKIERARRAATKGPFVPPPADAESGFFHPLGPAQAAAIAARSPEGHQPAGAALDRIDDLDDGAVGDLDPDGAEPVHALSSYNAYLARLAAGGARKSWRNPHGAPTRSSRR